MLMLLTVRFAALFMLPLCAITATAQDWARMQPPIWSAKPDVAAFEKVENDRLAAAQRAVDRLVAVKPPRTVDNTLSAYDEAVRQLNSAAYLAGLMEQVHPQAEFRDHASAMIRKVSAAQTALALNRDVYHALAALELSGADAATRYYVQRQLLEFRLAGVDKDDATRARLKQLIDQLTEEQTTYDRNISDGTKTVEVTSDSHREGMPQDYTAHPKSGPHGKTRITTENPPIPPAASL